MKKHKMWWNNLGSYSKKIYQVRHYPATNWEWLSDEQIQTIYQKEKTINNEN